MRILYTFMAMAALLAATPLLADCTSKNCVDCQQTSTGRGSCVTVSRAASCSCSVNVSYPDFCILEGACDYSPGGGGSGGGGAGGGGEVCYRPAGGWCPPECSSCETVYWH